MLAWLTALQMSSSAVDSAPRPISQLVHTTWTAKDGAPTEIIDLGQTSDGYLWLGTRSGLVRFDGVRFVPFAPRGGDTIPSGGVRRLLGTRDGSLWIVWLSGAVSRLRDGRIRSFGEKDRLSPVRQLTESSTGVLVAAMSKGLAQFVGGRWKDISREWHYPAAQSTAVWFDGDDALWAETDDRIVYRPARSEQFLDPGFHLIRGRSKTEFAQAKDGTVWMAEIARSAHTIPRIRDTLSITEVMVGAWSLLIDRKGSLWIGTYGDGLRRVDPTRIRGKKIAQFGREAEHFTEKEGLLSDLVYAVREDHEGNIWVATTRGLERFREGAFTPIATPGSARGRFVYATRDSSIWTAAQNADRILRLRRGQQDAFFTGRLTARRLVEDSSGTKWIINGARILRFDGRRFVPIPLIGNNEHVLSDITVDRDGTLWVFSDPRGLLRVRHDSLIQVASPPPLPWNSGILFSDHQGRVWVPQVNRLDVLDHGAIRAFGPADGIGSGLINTIYQDRAGRIWVGSDGGLSRLEGGRFRALSGRRVTGGRSVYGVTEDDNGAWWIATDRAVLRLPPGELDRAMADSAYVARYRSFDTQDGLPGMLTNITIGGGGVITRSADGRIWVATDSGVASTDPRAIPIGPAPTVLIEAVRIGERELAPSEAVEIPPNNREIEIDYTATSLSIPERVQFRYRLAGEDPTWRDAGSRRRAYYTRLAPGTHRFQVIASNGDGVWSESGAVLSFRVLPTWYQTLWFRTTVVLLIGSLGAAAAVLVQRRRHLRAQETLTRQYEATLAERARIAQDLHDTLLQGFAGVTLQLKTAELALPEQPDVAAETLMRVQRLARESLREARERVWDMREAAHGREDLAATLDAIARERTAGTGIEVSTAVTGQRRHLTRAVEDAAFRIGREAVVNAVRHARPRRIEIEIEFLATSLRLEVRDDGVGFTPQDAEAARKNGHFGLSGVRERATQMGGVCHVHCRPQGGTIVSLELPLAESVVR
jgi:signal transduction histidine kinase/ligand-binding sensor domain-containing protein